MPTEKFIFGFSSVRKILKKALNVYFSFNGVDIYLSDKFQREKLARIAYINSANALLCNGLKNEKFIR